MIEIYSKTLWQGQVAVRDKVVKEAIDRKEGLLIRHKNEFMAIPLALLKEKMAGKSKQSFKDYFGRGRNYLIYFQWLPQVAQGVML